MDVEAVLEISPEYLSSRQGWKLLKCGLSNEETHFRCSKGDSTILSRSGAEGKGKEVIGKHDAFIKVLPNNDCISPK
jgi:hypothetical protein